MTKLLSYYTEFFGILWNVLNKHPINKTGKVNVQALLKTAVLWASPASVPALATAPGFSRVIHTPCGSSRTGWEWSAVVVWPMPIQSTVVHLLCYSDWIKDRHVTQVSLIRANPMTYSGVTRKKHSFFSWIWNFKEELTHLKRPWCWERLMAGGEGDDRGLDGWMASPTRWTLVWVNSRSWWWTRKPCVLQSMGGKELDRTEQLNCKSLLFLIFLLF